MLDTNVRHVSSIIVEIPRVRQSHFDILFIQVVKITEKTGEIRYVLNFFRWNKFIEVSNLKSNLVFVIISSLKHKELSR